MTNVERLHRRSILRVGRLGASAVFVFFAVACASTPKVRHSTDPQIQPSAYRTYNVLEHQVGRSEADVVVKNALRRIMAVRGYAQAPSESADLLVTYKVLANQRPLEAAPPLADQVASVVSPGDGGMLGELIPMGMRDEPRVEKLLMVQLQDASTMQVVWVGWARNTVRESELLASTADLIVRILARLPHRT